MNNEQLAMNVEQLEIHKSQFFFPLRITTQNPPLETTENLPALLPLNPHALSG
jgi:hypothetical protein